MPVWSRVSQVTVAQTALMLISYSSDRTAYEISTPAANRITIAPDPGVATGTGHTLQVSTVYQWSQKHGHDVKNAVFAISAAGNNIVTIREDFITEYR